MNVCDKCFADLEIKQFIISTSKNQGRCDCCDENGALIDVRELLDFFTEFITIFKENNVDGRSLVELIQEDWFIFSSIDTGTKFFSSFDVLTSLASIAGVSLPGLKLDPMIRVTYVDEISESVSYWHNLKDDLKWERRFLTDIEEMTGINWNSILRISAKMDSRNLLFRARINQNGQVSPFNKENMGKPEKYFSTAGRANPQGIPYLYLSKALETTLYEARATFLDNISIGTFRIKDNVELTLVDFTQKFSPFTQEGQIINFTKEKLIKDAISKDLSRPLRRYDSELEYIPTQFICEFIRFNIEADGIQFKSSLEKEGVNIVLFDQSKVECIDVEVHQITEVKIKSSKVL
jgi:hypothetical protein